MSQLKRQITVLQQELEQERKINEENRNEMRQLEQDMMSLGEVGTNTENTLQNKLDDLFA